MSFNNSRFIFHIHRGNDVFTQSAIMSEVEQTVSDILEAEMLAGCGYPEDNGQEWRGKEPVTRPAGHQRPPETTRPNQARASKCSSRATATDLATRIILPPPTFFFFFLSFSLSLFLFPSRYVLMSNLISSFIIDPVVRQARRFSGALPPSEDNAHAGRRSLSHANIARPSPLHSPPSTSEHSLQDARVENVQSSRTENDPTSLLDHVRLSSLQAGGQNASSTAIVDDNDSDGESRTGNDGVDENDGTAQAHGPRLAPAFVLSSTSGLPVNVPVDASMPSDSNRLLDAEFGQLNIRSSPVDIPNTDASTRRHADTIPISSPLNAPSISESLPADDGMRHLRARIHEIRSLTMADADKARMMHSLMTERYNLLRPQSPNSFVSNDRPFTPTSGQSIFSDIHASSPTSLASDIDSENPFNLRPGDTDPTYRVYTLDQSLDDIGEEDLDTFDDGPAFGCQHYKRNVKVQCFHCRRWYTCRNCHDAVEDHNLERAKTRNMLCMACGTPQRAGEHCIECGTVAAWYYCDICKLWDDDSSKKIYHCIDCGICRKGEGVGRDYFHCKVRCLI